MTTKISTGMANYLLAVGSLKQAMANSMLRVYSGQEPAAADDGVPGSVELLAEFSVDGNGGGISLDATANGAVITKNPLEAWRATAINSGTAVWFRWSPSNDSGGASQSDLRIQGTVGVVGAELNFQSTQFVQGAIQKVDYFAVAMPAN